MTTSQNRTPAGIPTGGQFAGTDRPDANVALTGSRVAAADLKRGDQITSGKSIVTVTDIEASSLMPGAYAIETEVGTLYLGGDEQVEIADGAKRFVVDLDGGLTDDQFNAVFNEGARREYFVSGGSYMTSDSIRNSIETAIDCEMIDDELFELADEHRSDPDFERAVIRQVFADDFIEEIRSRGWSPGTDLDVESLVVNTVNAELRARAAAGGAAV